MQTKIVANKEEVADEIEKLFDDLSSKMKIKALEYSRNGDPFHNFNQGSLLRNKDPREILAGFMLKQVISVFDLVDDITAGKHVEPSVLDEKAGDIIIYLALLRSMNNVVANEKLGDLPF